MYKNEAEPAFSMCSRLRNLHQTSGAHVEKTVVDPLQGRSSPESLVPEMQSNYEEQHRIHLKSSSINHSTYMCMMITVQYKYV